MNRLWIIGFLLLLYTSCVRDTSFTFKSHFPGFPSIYKGQLARSSHPLTLCGESRNISTDESAPWLHPLLPVSHSRIVLSQDRETRFAIQKVVALYPDLDLCEPVSKKFLAGYIDQSPYPSMITIGQELYFHFQLDNDIFNYTDRFYTNGFHFILITPRLQLNPLVRLLVPYWNRGVNYYGISLAQKMYTPSTTKIGGLLKGDRPYAAYLYLGCHKITNDVRNKVRLSSELQVGILGPSSLGEYVQRTFHTSVPSNHEPLGWEFQIHDDLLLNYAVRIEKGMVSIPGLDLHVWGSGCIGTVYTNLAAGTYLRSGWFNNYFSNLFLSKKSLNQSRHDRNTQFYFFADFAGKAVGYNATLQGGIFNRSSPYTISADKVNRFLFSASGGIVFSYGGIQVKGEQFLLSPEFENGWWHKWLSIGLTFCF